MEGRRFRRTQRNNGDHDQEQKINVFLKINKTVCVSVKKSDTVENVKALLKEKEGMSDSVLGLIFSGECLMDDRKLDSYGIQDNSTVQVFVQDFVPLILFVKPLSDPNIIAIEAKSSNTIEDVKSAIMVKEGTFSSSFSLIYAGEQLAGDMTLKSLNIQGGSTLYMVANTKDEMKLSVKLPFGEIKEIKVKLLYSVRDVKAVVESLAGYILNDYTFVYEGVCLEDSEKLSSYDIAEESMLEMVPKSVRIFVLKMDGKRWSYDVYPGDLVIHLKERLAARLSITPNNLRLIFEGISLRNHQTLASYNVKNETTLNLMITQRGG